MRPFLARVISNHFRSLARRHRRELPCAEALDRVAASAGDGLRQWFDEVEQAMRRRFPLQPLTVRIFALARAGYTLQQIGAQVGLGSTEVHRRLCKARGAFAEIAVRELAGG